MINSLCIIPELTCKRQCPYCYEKMKKYGQPLPMKEFVNVVSSTMETLPSLTEVLIDYNGLLSKKDLLVIIQSTGLPTTITTTLDGLKKMMPMTGVKIHLSIHTQKDMTETTKLIGKHPGLITSVSIMIDDINEFNIDSIKVPIYLLYDKFSFRWEKDLPHLAADYLSILARYKDNDITIDHCLQTRLNGQECPAHTQLNLYRDGTARRCPYENEGSKDFVSTIASDHYTVDCNLLLGRE